MEWRHEELLEVGKRNLGRCLHRWHTALWIHVRIALRGRMSFCVVEALENQLLICLSIDRHEKEEWGEREDKRRE
jgi:hypothetical protein